MSTITTPLSGLVLGISLLSFLLVSSHIFIQVGYSQNNVINGSTQTINPIANNTEKAIPSTNDKPLATDSTITNDSTQTINPIANNIERSTYSNTTRPLSIDLKSENGGANLTYFIETVPVNGIIYGVKENSKEVPDGMINYVPNSNFNGTEQFTYISQNSEGIKSGKGLIVIFVKASSNPIASVFSDENIRNSVAFVLAIIIVIIIAVVSRSVIARIRDKKNPGFKSRFTDIMRGHDMDPSLSIFQFLSWTFVLMFVFISVYFIRIFGGFSDPPQAPLPVYLLAIAGISVATPILSTLISSFKYATSSPVQFYRDDESKPLQTMDEYSTSNKDKLKTIRPSFGEMLREFGKPTLARFQMFAWTWIGIVVYLSVFFSKVIENSNSVQNLSIPDVDPTLVILMGLSQFAFLAAPPFTTTTS